MAKFKEEGTINLRVLLNRTYSRFLIEYKGVDEEEEDELTLSQFVSISLDDSDDEQLYNQHFIQFRKVNSDNTMAILNDNIVFYIITRGVNEDYS